jgi:prepilin-type N-terminal cleavage/methylation domain-containing protein
MPLLHPRRSTHGALGQTGFSLVELLVSVALITILMGAVFSFMYQCQKRFQSNAVVSEANQTARAALEVMTQEIGQAGYNPQFYPNRTASSSINALAAEQCVTLNDISMINPGDWLQVDTGPNEELVQVTGISTNGACSVVNQIQAVFEKNHTPAPVPFLSYKFPYPSGIILGTSGTNSDDHNLLFYGDINNDGVIRYVVYSLSPTTSPATTLNIASGAYPGNYTLYNLYRSVTTVGFPGAIMAGTNNSASVLIQNVLYNTSSSYGPTGQPIFAYPQEFLLGYSPNQITVLGTLVVTVSVAVNPRSLETGVVQWYTMATQIRPLNLAAAVSVNRSGGGQYLAKMPNDLPMTNPSSYYQ